MHEQQKENKITCLLFCHCDRNAYACTFQYTFFAFVRWKKARCVIYCCTQRGKMLPVFIYLTSLLHFKRPFSHFNNNFKLQKLPFSTLKQPHEIFIISIFFLQSIVACAANFLFFLLSSGLDIAGSNIKHI